MQCKFLGRLPDCYYLLYFFRPSGRKRVLGRVSNKVLNKRHSCVTGQIELALKKVINFFCGISFVKLFEAAFPRPSRNHFWNFSKSKIALR